MSGAFIHEDFYSLSFNDGFNEETAALPFISFVFASGLFPLPRLLPWAARPGRRGWPAAGVGGVMQISHGGNDHMPAAIYMSV